jgi:hypothetical protein
MSNSDSTPPVGSGQSSQTPSSTSSGQPAPFTSDAYTDSLAVWQKFLSVGGNEATIEQAKQFQALVVKGMCSQIQEESDRAVEALRKMREDNEESQS